MKVELDAFKLNVIAIFAMTCNHVANAFMEVLPQHVLFPLYIIGGITFPILAYLLTEGYRKTSNVKKYMLRMLLFGLISLFPYFWALFPKLNILITLLLGLVCLYLHDRMKNNVLFGFCFAGIILFSVVCDWGVIGIIMIFLYGTIKNDKRRLMIPNVVNISALLLILLPERSFYDGIDVNEIFLAGGFAMAGLLVIPLLFAYNGKRGYSTPAFRYIFYIYYPVHLLVLAGIKWLI